MVIFDSPTADDYSNLVRSAQGPVATYADLVFAEAIRSVGQTSKAMIESSELLVALVVSDQRIALAHVSDWRPYDSVCTLRFFDLPDASDASAEDVRSCVDAAVDFARARLGCRKVSLRFPARLDRRSQVHSAVFDAYPVEGVLRDFWFAGCRRHDEVICASTLERTDVGSFAPTAAVFGASTANTPQQWSSWGAVRFGAARHTARYQLLAPTDGDIEELHALETDSRLVGWIFRGATPGRAAFQSQVTNGVAHQKVVRWDGNRLAGRISLYDVSEALHYGKVAVVIDPALWVTGLAARVTLDFVGDCFNRLPLEILSFETSALSPASGVRALARRLHLDAHLVDDRMESGRVYDRFIFSLTRSEAAQLPLLRRRLSAPHNGVPT